MNLYKWQGEDVEVEFGFSIIKPNTEKILYWTNYHVRDKESVELPSIKVITNAKRNHSINNPNPSICFYPSSYFFTNKKLIRRRITSYRPFLPCRPYHLACHQPYLHLYLLLEVQRYYIL